MPSLWRGESDKRRGEPGRWRWHHRSGERRRRATPRPHSRSPPGSTPFPTPGRPATGSTTMSSPRSKPPSSILPRLPPPTRPTQTSYPSSAPFPSSTPRMTSTGSVRFLNVSAKCPRRFLNVAKRSRSPSNRASARASSAACRSPSAASSACFCKWTGARTRPCRSAKGWDARRSTTAIPTF